MVGYFFGVSGTSAVVVVSTTSVMTVTTFATRDCLLSGICWGIESLMATGNCGRERRKNHGLFNLPGAGIYTPPSE